MSPRFQIPRSATITPLSKIFETEPTSDKVQVTVSLADIRAAAESRLRPPCNPATPRGVRHFRHKDVMPGTPHATKWVDKEGDIAEERGCEIWLEGSSARSGPQVVKSLLRDVPVDLMRTPVQERQADDPTPRCGRSSRVFRQGPSMSCNSVTPPRSLKTPPRKTEAAHVGESKACVQTRPSPEPGRAGGCCNGFTPKKITTPLGKIARAEKEMVEIMPSPNVVRSGDGTSASVESSTDIEFGFWNVLGMMTNAACCSGPPAACVALSGRPAVSGRLQPRCTGEFVVDSHPGSCKEGWSPVPVPESDILIPECWARADRPSSFDGDAFLLGDDEVLVASGQRMKVRVDAAGLQKQSRCGGA